MPNFAKILKDEIRRLARKEARTVVAPVSRKGARLRRDAAALKRRLAMLEKTTRRLQMMLAKLETAQPAAAPTEESKAWISGKGIKALRRKLGLSQAELAALAQVTPVTVYKWEHQPRKLKLRQRTRATVLALRGIGAREARRRLEELGRKRKTTARRKRRRRTKR